MDDTEDGARPVDTDYADDEEEDETDDDEELGDEEEYNNGQNGYPFVHKGVRDDDHEDDSDDEEDEDDEKDNKMMVRRLDDDDLKTHPKKRKLKSLISSYEFAPRLPAPLPPVVAAFAPRQSIGGRNALTDLTEREIFVLLDAWGDRFLQCGKKSLCSEEWQEVPDKVSEQAGLSCGLDSGDYVFMNPKVYLNSANGLDEMMDSLGNSESIERGDDDSDGLPPKKRRYGRENDDPSSFRLLADSIQKFSNIYEKIENSKRKQMVELEKMRMDFHRDLEL
ncbi:hypothetical protein C1H46_039540 [Malus baccata]|uniref:Uncharacterized protein n=1 Tax=Malus baccata TaxID=106549 RepID=A0A540KL31_MALBA|nr:hypothetical protein C1H46_039540 [Malus baccata]